MGVGQGVGGAEKRSDRPKGEQGTGLGSRGIGKRRVIIEGRGRSPYED